MTIRSGPSQGGGWGVVVEVGGEGRRGFTSRWMSVWSKVGVGEGGRGDEGGWRS